MSAVRSMSQLANRNGCYKYNRSLAVELGIQPEHSVQQLLAFFTLHWLLKFSQTASQSLQLAFLCYNLGVC